MEAEESEVKTMEMIGAWVVALALALAGAPAEAQEDAYDQGQTFVVYAGDALLLRPFMLGATLAGGAVYVASFPFTVLADDERAFDALVRAPARAAFMRCMGCEVGEER